MDKGQRKKVSFIFWIFNLLVITAFYNLWSWV